ncbi:MAG TPA: extracellular solute-binding protein [Acidimicrobiales bacterium]
MRRRLRWLGVLTACALVFAACGDDDDDGGAQPDTTQEDGGDTTEAPSLEGQSIEVAAVWSAGSDEQPNFEAVLDLFEEQTGASVTFVSTGDDIATVLGTRLEGGDPPDVAMLPQPGLMRDLVNQGALRPIEDIAGDLVDENFAPIWRELGSVNGELYGVWFKAANKSTFWYRPDLLEDAGVEPPETWDELIDVAQAISDSGVTPLSIGGGDGWTLTDWFENVYLRSAGAEMYDQLAAHEIPWTDPSVVEALGTLADLWSRPGFVLPNSTTTLFPDSVARVFNEPPQAAMVYEGDFVAGTIAGETTAVVGEDADFFPFPSINDSPPSVVGGGDVAVLLTDNPAAQELIRFLTTPEAAEVWVQRGGFTSPNQNVDTSLYPDDISRRSAEQLLSAEDFRFDLSDQQPAAFGGTPAQGMWKILQDFLADPSNPEATAQQLEAGAAAVFA